MRYRHFRNADPPGLAAAWNESVGGRGAVEIRSPALFDEAVFNKPYFDPAGLIVAEDDDRSIVGFAHGGFGPNEELTAIDHRTGIICALVVRPPYRRRGVGRELLRRCEEYLHASGAREILAGPIRPNKPFYTGLYGGSNAPGFLLSDGDAEPFFLSHGYIVNSRVLVFSRKLDNPIQIVDTRFGALKKRFVTHIVPQARLGSWWRESVLGPLDPAEFRLDDIKSGQTGAKALFWEMKEFGWRWGAPAAGIIDVQVRNDLRRAGLGKFLLFQLLKHLQDQYFAIAEAQVPERDETPGHMFRELGFQQVDVGVTYRKISTFADFCI